MAMHFERIKVLWNVDKEKLGEPWLGVPQVRPRVLWIQEMHCLADGYAF